MKKLLLLISIVIIITGCNVSPTKSDINEFEETTCIVDSCEYIRTAVSMG